MQKKFGLVGIPILLAFLIVVTAGNIQLLPDLNTETQTITEVQTEIVPEVSMQQSQIVEDEEQPVKEYTLIIEQTDIQISDTAVWYAWTYNGTVPAPTLMVNQGDLLRVRVINNHDVTHSFMPI